MSRWNIWKTDYDALEEHPEDQTKRERKHERAREIEYGLPHGKQKVSCFDWI